MEQKIKPGEALASRDLQDFSSIPRISITVFTIEMPETFIFGSFTNMNPADSESEILNPLALLLASYSIVTLDTIKAESLFNESVSSLYALISPPLLLVCHYLLCQIVILTMTQKNQ